MFNSENLIHNKRGILFITLLNKSKGAILNKRLLIILGFAICGFDLTQFGEPPWPSDRLPSALNQKCLPEIYTHGLATPLNPTRKYFQLCPEAWPCIALSEDLGILGLVCVCVSVWEQTPYRYQGPNVLIYLGVSPLKSLGSTSEQPCIGFHW